MGVHSVVSLDSGIHGYMLHYLDTGNCYITWTQAIAVLLSFLYSGYITMMEKILEIV